MRKDINDVFTPRRADVNMDIYVDRELLESELERKLRGTQNIIVHGESGCGKSWLYKKVLKEKQIPFKVVNLALADSYEGILKIIEDEAKADDIALLGYTEKKLAEANLGIVKGGVDHVNEYTVGGKTALFRYLDRFFDKKPGFICFENAEVIFGNAQLMKELGNLIILLDDESFAKYKTKFLIVGVPAGILDYYSRTKNLPTVSNRLIELSEVVPMTKTQVDTFVEKGFIKHLRIKFDSPNDKQKLCNHIFYITGGIPQSMHEYSVLIGYLLEENKWRFSEGFLEVADKQWLEDSLYKNYEVIQQLMNSENTSIGRRNQVLYCLGKLESKSFSISDLDNLVRQEFPISCMSTTLNLSIPLGDIEENKVTFIKRHAKSYYISDMKFILCIRTMLKKENEKVLRIDLNNL